MAAEVATSRNDSLGHCHDVTLSSNVEPTFVSQSYSQSCPKSSLCVVADSVSSWGVKHFRLIEDWHLVRQVSLESVDSLLCRCLQLPMRSSSCQESGLGQFLAHGLLNSPKHTAPPVFMAASADDVD
jgi:hypothetical protein